MLGCLHVRLSYSDVTFLTFNLPLRFSSFLVFILFGCPLVKLSSCTAIIPQDCRPIRLSLLYCDLPIYFVLNAINTWATHMKHKMRHNMQINFPVIKLWFLLLQQVFQANNPCK